MGFAKIILLEVVMGPLLLRKWDPKEDYPLTCILPVYLMYFDLRCLATLDSHEGNQSWMVGIMGPINYRRKVPRGCIAGWALCAGQVDVGASLSSPYP